MACPRKSIVRGFCPTRYGFQRIAGRPDGRVPERAEGGASGRGRTAGRGSDRRSLILYRRSCRVKRGAGREWLHLPAEQRPR